MSSFLNSSNLSKASNLTQSSLVSNNSYYGGIDATNVPIVLLSSYCGSYPYIEVSVKTSVPLAISVQQSNIIITDDDDVVSAQLINAPVNINPTTGSYIFYTHIGFPYFRLVLQNESDPVVAGDIKLTTKLVSVRPSNALTHKDSVLISALDSATGTPTSLTTTDGRLKVEADVTLENIILTPADDGVAVYGSSDGGTDRLILKTDAGGTLNTVSTTADALLTALNALVTENKNLLTKLEINANQAPVSTLLVNDLVGIEYAIGDTIGYPIDMGSMETRDNDICFSGHVNIETGFENPKMIMQFSLADTVYFGDGVECSFYKKNAVTWEFNFQRNNVGPRFVRLLCTSPVKLTLCLATKFKN